MKIRDYAESCKTIKADVDFFPYIEIGDINLETKEYVIKDKKSVPGSFISSCGEILVSTVRPTRGAVTIVKENKAAVSSAFAIVKPDLNKCDPRYLFYCLNSKPFLDYLGMNSKGATYPTCSKEDVFNYNIKASTKHEQAAIVKKLDLISSIIRNLKTEQRTFDNLIKARFVEMFGDVKTGTYKYETRKLGDVTEVGSSHRVFTTEFVENGIPFYRGTEIGELANGIKPVNPYHITKEHYDRLACDETKPKIGDLLMPSICNKGQVWMVDTEEPFYYKDGRVLCISPNRELFNCKFLEQFMREKTLVEYPKLGSGSTFAEFKIFLLKEIDVLLPPIELQNQFAVFCKQIDKSKFVVQKALEKAQQLFDSLMQQYFG